MSRHGLQVTQDRDRLCRERQDVSWPIRVANPSALHLSGRNGPSRRIEIEFSPPGMSHFAGSLKDERNETQCRTRHRQALVILDRTQQLPPCGLAPQFRRDIRRTCPRKKPKSLIELGFLDPLVPRETSWDW